MRALTGGQTHRHTDGTNSIPLTADAGGKKSSIPVLDLVMIAPIQLQCIFSYAILANPEVDPHALKNINKNWYLVVLLKATNVRDPHLGHE